MGTDAVTNSRINSNRLPPMKRDVCTRKAQPLKATETKPVDTFEAQKEKPVDSKPPAKAPPVKKRGFFSRLFGGLKRAFKFVLPMLPKLLNFIPVVGPMLSTAASTFIH